jgi:hypothetical protein
MGMFISQEEALSRLLDARGLLAKHKSLRPYEILDLYGLSIVEDTREDSLGWKLKHKKDME